MENRLERIEKSLDMINKRLMEYNTQLALHIEGVVQNRSHISKIERDLDGVIAHVHEVNGIGKFIKWLSLSIGLIGGILGLLKVSGAI